VTPWPALLLAAAAVGCGAPDEVRRPAEQAAEGFLAAVASQDGARACDLLTPEARRALESDGPCTSAVVELELPPAEAVTSAEVYGHHGVVAAGGQRVFVTRTDGGWRVVAAGCVPRGDQPPECELDAP